MTTARGEVRAHTGGRVEPPGDVGGPHRRHTLWARISADDPEKLINELAHIQRELSRGNLSQSSISGGYSTGHIIVHSVDGSMDHDKWAQELDAWFVEQDADKARSAP